MKRTLSTDEQNTKRLRIVIVGLVLILVFIGGRITIQAQSVDVYLISAAVPKPGSRHQTFPPTIYRLNKNEKDLTSVWELDEENTLSDVALFHELKSFIIATSGAGLQSILAFDMQSPSKPAKFNLSGAPLALTYRWYTDQPTAPVIELVGYRAGDIRAEMKLNFFQCDLSTGSVGITEKSDIREFQVSGIEELYFENPSRNIVRLEETSEGMLVPYYTSDDIDVPLVYPDSIGVTSSKGWLWILNTPTFSGMVSIPDKKNQSERHLLLHNRIKDSWSMHIIPGAETRLRDVGGWLAGVIKETSSDTDYESGYGLPAHPTTKSILIELSTRVQLAVELGALSHVLLIRDDNTLYYTKDDSLFTARVDSAGLTDNSFVLNDRKLRFIHWAFEN